MWLRAFYTGIAKLFSQPRLTIPLVLTLGLTLGAVLSVANLSNTLFLKALPGVYQEDDIYSYDINLSIGPGVNVPFINGRKLNHLSEHFSSSGTWAAISAKKQPLTIDNISQEVTSISSTPNILSILGSRVLAGQGALIENPEQYIWLSKSLAEENFGDAESALNQIITVEGQPLLVAGVIEDVLAIKSSDPILAYQYWKILNVAEAAKVPDGNNISGDFSTILLKKHQGQTPPNESAIEQWKSVYINSDSETEQNPAFLEWINSLKASSVVSPYRSALLGETDNLLLALLIVVTGLLIMASLNLLNMFIVHYQNRSQEFTLQITNGAKLNKLRMLIWVENLPMFVCSALLGILAAGWLIRLIPVLAGNSIPLLSEVQLDLQSILLAIIIICGINAIFSLAALIHINKKQLIVNLNASGKGTQKQSSHWVSSSLMIGQIAIATILLTTTIMLASKSYHTVYRDLGYNHANTYEISLNSNTLSEVTITDDPTPPDATERVQLNSDLAKIIVETVDGVSHVFTGSAPLSNSFSIHAMTTEGKQEPLVYESRGLNAEYFTAFSIPFLAGSNLTEQAILSQTNKVVIDERMAKVLYPELALEDVIGKPFGDSGGDESRTPATIAGVVANTVSNLFNSQVSSFPVVYSTSISFGDPLFTVKTSGRNTIDDTATAKLFEAIKAAYPQYEDMEIKSSKEIWLEQTRSQRMALWVLITISVLTAALAAIGISGLTQMSIAQRSQELAIRMATGASQKRLMGLVLKSSSLTLVLGLVFGFLLSVYGYQETQNWLDILPDFNWQLMIALDIGLIALVLIATLIPAWRIIGKDPMKALRQE